MDFLVTCLPRSGSSWLSALLNTAALCLHDPVARLPLKSVGTYGYVDTQALFEAREVNALRCQKLVLVRPLAEVNASLERVGLPPMREEHKAMLDSIEAPRLEWRLLFDYDALAPHFRRLTGRALDARKHAEFCNMNIQDTASLQMARDVIRHMRG